MTDHVSPVTYNDRFSQNAKIYIAGHRGLVGSAILRKLQSEGYTNIITRTHAELDLTRQADVESFFEQERPEYVFLAAAKVGGILANNTYPADFIYINLMIQTNVIHAAWEYGVKKLLFLGSSCIYPKFAPQPMKEEYLLTGELEPTNEPYAVAKIAGIKMCQAYNRQYGTDFISVMPTNLYGPNDNFDLMNSHVLPALIRKFHLAKLLAKGDFEQIRQDFMTYGNREIIINGRKISINENTPEEEILLALAHFGITSSPHDRIHASPHQPVKVTLWGTGSPRREFLHVDDLADACVFLMFHPRIPASSHPPIDASTHPLINIGTGKDIPIKELAEMVKEIVGFEGDINWDSTKPDGTPRKLLDVSKLRSLGWEEKIKFADGIRQTYEWYLSHASTH